MTAVSWTRRKGARFAERGCSKLAGGEENGGHDCAIERKLPTAHLLDSLPLSSMILRRVSGVSGGAPTFRANTTSSEWSELMAHTECGPPHRLATHLQNCTSCQRVVNENSGQDSGGYVQLPALTQVSRHRGTMKIMLAEGSAEAVALHGHRLLIKLWPVCGQESAPKLTRSQECVD